MIGNTRLVVLMSVTISLFIVTSFGVITHNFILIDTYGTSYIQSFKTDWLTELLIIITHIGSYKIEYPIFLLLAIYWLIRKETLFPPILLINLIGAQVLNRFLKEQFVRERPVIEHIVDVTGYSFPSGHAMISTAYYGFIAYLICRTLNYNKTLCYCIQISIGTLIFLIGLSRIYLGVHYPSDVIGGFFMGFSWLIFTVLILHKFQYLLETRNGGA
ncbi:phosphatase PAP2 family protein [Bacillus sp. Marseille-P3661]|uniref:phosphatase PAP2 family protein n=1 Tax=Bacillus sp. Marseille-P3661 TaxID=1936234 RepID=UPI000C868536|nr:phosphatase PAP2 family protein [Bacillus sp. Marseille-P3661]